MSVRRRNKKLQQESKVKHLPTYNDRGDFVGFREELKEPVTWSLPEDPGLQNPTIAAERERLQRVVQEQRKIDYVLRLKRYGFKMGKAHKA